MKKIIFLIIATIYGVSCLGQKIALSASVSINLPAGIETLNRDQFSAYVNDKFGHSKIALIVIPDPGERMDNKNFYWVNDVLIEVVNDDKPVKENHLSEMKKGYDAMYSSIKEQNHYTSIIKTVNNNQVLIMYDDWENVGSYHFHCWNSTYTSVLAGVLQFNTVDKDKATKILDDILNGIEFKK
jgi:hypothetical protein